MIKSVKKNQGKIIIT